MSDDKSKSELSSDPRIGACVYLLHGLLQRLEMQQPGLILEMTNGIRSDRAAMNPDSSAAVAQGCEIADEALRMLHLMSEQLKLPQAPPPQG